ncbi:MAG: RES domain-containing protein [Thermomicrobiales bacterium]
MPLPLVTTISPEEGVVRIARRSGGAFEPPSWEYVLADGTFGNRFDDPTNSTSRFRVIYCTTTSEAAFGETLARFRPSLDLLASLRAIVDESDDDLDDLIAASSIIPADWRMKRQIASATIADRSHAKFVDIDATASQQVLRTYLASIAVTNHLHDIDKGAIAGQARQFTQSCSRFIYEQHDAENNYLYAGIRYGSRLNPNWECWACFADRVTFDVGFPRTIDADDGALIDVADLFHLSIEVLDGHMIRTRIR